MKRKIITALVLTLIFSGIAVFAFPTGEPAPPVKPGPAAKPAPAAKPPVVKITSPRGGWTSERIVDFKGTISDPKIDRLKLVFNGVPMTIRAEGGNFAAKLVLSPGSNCIQAVAENVAGVGRDAITTFAKVPAKDMKVTLTWDTNGTDIDMHVIDPTGEECSYEHQSTKMGGNLDVDVTTGFGPETFTLARAERGKYLIEVNYFSSHGNAQTACRVDVILFEGSSKERRETHRFVLTRDKERRKVAEVFVR